VPRPLRDSNVAFSKGFLEGIAPAYQYCRGTAIHDGVPLHLPEKHQRLSEHPKGCQSRRDIRKNLPGSAPAEEKWEEFAESNMITDQLLFLLL
jgi:hypothetical protein